jgi:hypothetical protein
MFWLISTVTFHESPISLLWIHVRLTLRLDR